MIEFAFRVVVQCRDAQAFNDTSDEAAHDRLTKRIFEALATEFAQDTKTTVEVEPV